jgi:hypothetical protein
MVSFPVPRVISTSWLFSFYQFVIRHISFDSDGLLSDLAQLSHSESVQHGLLKNSYVAVNVLIVIEIEVIIPAFGRKSVDKTFKNDN